MKPEEFFSVLDEHHVDYDRDYVGSLSRDHNSNNIFIRFVANVKLKRFFEYVLSRRSEPKARQAFRDISKRLTELIIEDWKELDSQEEFDNQRKRFYSDLHNNSDFNGDSRVIRYYEPETKNLFGSDCWAPYFKNAVREYWRLDQEPRLLNTDIWELEDIKKNYALYEEDLQEFKSNPKPITQPQTTENNPPELQEPTVRKWEHEKQYLGFITAELIPVGTTINVDHLSKTICKYFRDKNGNKFKTHNGIRQNITYWRNPKNDVDEHRKNCKVNIMEMERKHIQAVIDYFVKTR
jgi:hypothetical protein